MGSDDMIMKKGTISCPVEFNFMNGAVWHSIVVFKNTIEDMTEETKLYTTPPYEKQN